MSTAKKDVVATVSGICNPESVAVRLSDVLSAVARRKSTVENLQTVAGLCADHPEKANRDRFEITQSKCLVLDQLREDLESVPPLAHHLMGKKPSDLTSAVDTLSGVNIVLGEIKAGLALLPNSDALDSLWHRCFNVQRVLASVVDELSGSAGGQPEPREESRPLTGNPPVTVAGANPLTDFSLGNNSSVPSPGPVSSNDLFLHWIGECLPRLEDRDLGNLSEAALSEIDSRGLSFRWAAVAAVG